MFFIERVEQEPPYVGYYERGIEDDDEDEHDYDFGGGHVLVARKLNGAGGGEAGEYFVHLCG